MRDSIFYRLSLGLTVLLTLAALITLLSSLVALATGWGKLPIIELLPWKPVALLACAALNCTLRSHLILRQA
jgi:hypothetical protein